MKKILLVLFVVLCFTSQAQQWQWAKTLPYTYGSCLASDNSSNFYASTPANIIKFDSNGNELWQYHFIATSIAIRGIACFGNSVFVTGSFSGNLHFGSDSLINYGGDDIFVASFTNNGNYIWAKNFGGPLNDFGNGICSDINGNIYLTGGYSGTAIFGDSTLVCQGANNMFMVKLDSAGNVVLSKSAGCTNGTGSSGNKIKVDSSGNILIFGNFFDIVLDSIHVVGDQDYSSGFLCKLDSAGDAQWVRQWDNQTQNITDMTLDQTSDIIITGYRGWTMNTGTNTLKFNPIGTELWNRKLQPIYMIHITHIL